MKQLSRDFNNCLKSGKNVIKKNILIVNQLILSKGVLSTEK
jgi:hypothetical protein